MKTPSSPAATARGKRLWSWLLIGCLSCTAIGTAALHWGHRDETGPAERIDASPASDEPIQPIERPANLDSRKVNLGRKLFHDARLSHNNQIACANCHSLEKGGTDRRTRSVGIHGALGVTNAVIDHSKRATMSHEIRTPLNAILGMAEVLSSTSLDERQ